MVLAGTLSSSESGRHGTRLALHEVSEAQAVNMKIAAKIAVMRDKAGGRAACPENRARCASAKTGARIRTLASLQQHERDDHER